MRELVLNLPPTELQAPAGTYRFFDDFCGPAGPINQRRSELCSFERDGIGVNLYRGQDREGEPTGIYVTVYQPLEEEFCGKIYSMDITPDDKVTRLSANLNMRGAKRRLPEPQPDLDMVLQITGLVLKDQNLIG